MYVCMYVIFHSTVVTVDPLKPLSNSIRIYFQLTIFTLTVQTVLTFICVANHIQIAVFLYSIILRVFNFLTRSLLGK